MKNVEISPLLASVPGVGLYLANVDSILTTITLALGVVYGVIKIAQAIRDWNKEDK